MAIDTRKYEADYTGTLKDMRPAYARFGEWAAKPANAAVMFFLAAALVFFVRQVLYFGDIIFLIYTLYFLWLMSRDRTLAFKMPYGAKWKDENNDGPGRNKKAEGILYLGNVKDTDEEVWFTNSDARTHILYLGTTGAGKTEGLKSMVTNALSWGSGFVYVDGKADTDLWSSLSSLVRRFGRDDDLLVLNYMTGNSDVRAPSNTMNPFSAGSASYLTNMLVSLMPDAEGDNAMWKERAVALVASLMPALTWRRDELEIPMSIGTIRDYLNLNKIIELSRDDSLPEDLMLGVRGYLDTLPGYVDAAFDDNGQEKPPGPDQPAYDTTTPRQQHGYLSMQFTRALQSLADEYGYIFDTQAADVDMVDVVLNRRVLVVLIPALEKSSDETANLGKIVAATIKGMMGSTLGATVEGESATVIENKPTHSSTPFMTVFDEVGYYTAQGMAVMAAQARSLGFCLIYSAQDLPALEKRVKEEARSITANCNIKIFGKLEDPTQTKEFFEKTVGQTAVIETSGFQLSGSRGTGSYHDNQQASMQFRAKDDYGSLKGYAEGEATISFGEMVITTQIFYSNPGHAKAMRVTRFMSLPPPDQSLLKNASTITKLRDLMVHKSWTAMKADVALDTPEEIEAIVKVFKTAEKTDFSKVDAGKLALVGIHALTASLDAEEDTNAAAPAAVAPPAAPKKVDPPVTAQSSTAPAKAAPKKEEAPKAPAAAPPQTPPTTEKTEAKSDNPMSFFASKDSDTSTSAPQAAATPPAPTETPAAPVQPEPPVDYRDLVADSDEPSDYKLPPRKPLDPAVEDIIKKAGKDAKSSLFGKDDVEAAE